MIAGKKFGLTLLRCNNCHTGIELFDVLAPTMHTSWFLILLVLRNGGDHDEGLTAILADVFVSRHMSFSSTNEGLTVAAGKPTLENYHSSDRKANSSVFP
jgi:hypothetical protein